jgi:hypothetical protein
MQINGRQGCRPRLNPHGRLEPFHEQRSASDATGLHESTTVHSFFGIETHECEMNLKDADQITLAGLPITTHIGRAC